MDKLHGAVLMAAISSLHIITPIIAKSIAGQKPDDFAHGGMSTGTSGERRYEDRYDHPHSSDILADLHSCQFLRQLPLLECVMAELTATLRVGSWRTQCGNCGADVMYDDTHCVDVIGYNPRPGGGCGARFTAKQSVYIGTNLDHIRPDLPLEKGWWETE